jgi:conjugative transfer relaxase protein TraI
MLSVKVIKNVQNAKQYFIEQDNYYAKDSQEAKEASRWLGKGAEKLGLTGSIESEVFQRLLEGKLPNGMQVGKKLENGEFEHRPGWDLTFSAPKSVSILAEIGQDKRLYEAHDKAVAVALSYVERACAQARKTVSGRTVFENTKNMIAATFRHDTSRALDPNMHTHAVVMNMTERSDGQWRSMASDKFGYAEGKNGFIEQVYENKIYMGAIYRSELAYLVKQAGYGIEKTHSDGRFEIVGVPKDLIDCYSTRRKDIESFLKHKGWEGAKAAAFAALETRDQKQAMNREMLREGWLKGCQEFNFDIHSFIDKSFEKTAANILPQKDSSLSIEVVTALNQVIEQLSDQDVRLSHHKILNGVVSEILGEHDSKEAILSIGKAIKEGELIPLPQTSGELFYTTKEMIKAEEKLIERVINNQYKALPLISDNKVVESVNGRTDLSGEQKDAIIHLFTSGDRFTAIDGVSGSGKTKLISNIAQTLCKEKISALCLTTTKAQVKSLQSKQVQADTISAFLSKIESQNKSLTKKTAVILLDNAQQVSLKQLQTLFHHAEKAGNRIFLAGDTKGYLNYGSGSPFEQLIKGGMKTVELHEIQRNIIQPARLAVKDTLEGNLKSAVEKIGQRFIEIPNEEERLKKITNHYVSLTPDERKNTSLLMPSKQASFSINMLIRDELKNKNEISKQEYIISVMLPKYMTDIQKKYSKYYEIDSYLRFNEIDKKFRIKRGEYYQITSHDVKKNILTIKNAKGKIVEWHIGQSKIKLSSLEVFKLEERKLSVGEKMTLLRGMTNQGIHSGENITIKSIKKGKIIAKNSSGKKVAFDYNKKQFLHMDYAYTSTPHRVQHHTPKNIIAYHPSEAFQINQRDFYKVLTKASDNIWLYTDNKDNYLQTLKQKTGNKLSAIDALVTDSFEKDNALTFIVDKKKTNQEQISLLKNHIHKVIESLQVEYQDKHSTDPEKISLDAAKYAMKHLAERDAGFTHKELLEIAVTFALGNTHSEKIEQAISELVRSGELIKGVYRTDGTRWTTQDAIQREEQLLQIVKAGEGQVSPIANADEVAKHVENSILGVDQREAAKDILTTDNRFIILQAPPGSGKTTLMNTIRSVAESRGFTVKGIAPIHGAVRELAKEGISSQTLQSFLMEAKRFDDIGKQLDLNNHLFILDETSLVSSQDCLEFVKFIANTGARAVQSGDNRQHLAPEAGNPFDLQQKAGVQTAYLTEIRRQEKDKVALKNAVKLAMEKNYRGAIESVDSQSKSENDDYRLHQQNKRGKDHRTQLPRVVQIENKTERLQSMTEDFLARDLGRRENTILIAPRNEDRIIINFLVREGLKEQGQIAQCGETFSIFVPKHLTISQLTHHANYVVGDVIRFNRSISALGIKKGSYLAVSAIDAMDNRLVFKQDKDKELHWQLNHLPIDQRGVMEVYKRESREICEGDKIRWTRSDKSQGFLGGDQSTVVNVKKDSITLKNYQGEIVQLDANNPKQFHWDHAYAFTSYAIQGAGKPDVISHEDSKYKHLSSQRAFLVNLTRSKQQFTLYTDNKENLIKRITKTTGDKHIALDVIGKLKMEKQQKTTASNKMVKTLGPEIIKTWDAKDISNRLIESAEYIVEKLLGEPKKKLGREWRYGSNKGSLIITMQGDKRGFWYDHQTGEGGHLISLIAKQYGYLSKEEFRKTLDMAARLLGLSDSQKIDLHHLKKSPLASKINPLNELTEKQKKNIQKAKDLVVNSQPIHGTLAEQYLRVHRGITKPLPDSLRYHPAVKSYINGQTLPALLMVGRNEKNEIQGVQAIFLDPLTANKAKVEVVKQSFGVIGGSPITLQQGKSPASPTLICEGIETGLSLREADGEKTIKATLSLSNFLNIPKNLVSKEIIFCLDNDGEGHHSELLIKKACERLTEEGKDVYSNKPDSISGLKKTDYNDVLKQHGQDAVKNSINHSMRYQTENKLVKISDDFSHSEKIIFRDSPLEKSPVMMDSNLFLLNDSNNYFDKNNKTLLQKNISSPLPLPGESKIVDKNLEREL